MTSRGFFSNLRKPIWLGGGNSILCTAVASLTTVKVFFSNNRTLRHAVKIRLYDSLRADTQARQESNQPTIHEQN